MANIAAVFHWPPSEMNGMDLEELMMWHEEAWIRSPASEE